MGDVYKHTVFVNINNRIVRHVKEKSQDGILPGTDNAYSVSYNKVTELFRVVLYNYDEHESTTNSYIARTFREHCDSVTNMISTTVLSKKAFSEV